jgi:hypothetical protein
LVSLPNFHHRILHCIKVLPLMPISWWPLTNRWVTDKVKGRALKVPTLGRDHERIFTNVLFKVGRAGAIFLFTNSKFPKWLGYFVIDLEKVKLCWRQQNLKFQPLPFRLSRLGWVGGWNIKKSATLAWMMTKRKDKREGTAAVLYSKVKHMPRAMFASAGPFVCFHRKI